MKPVSDDAEAWYPPSDAALSLERIRSERDHYKRMAAEMAELDAARRSAAPLIGIDRQRIQQLALKAGFTLKKQESGGYDLSPCIYDLAERISRELQGRFK